jgi:DNA-directed RNA polymerase subunit RPC12/RpoP
MKCQTCKKRMDVIRVNYDFDLEGKPKKGQNIPACRCPQCGKTVIPAIIMGRLKAYAGQKKDGGNDVVDFAQCEEQEGEDMIALNMLGLF